MSGETHMRSSTQGLNLVDSVYERLLAERIIFLGSQIDDDIANRLCAQVLLLAAEDPNKDINLYINSPGGSISAGMAVYDTMVLAPCDIAIQAEQFAVIKKEMFRLNAEFTGQSIERIEADSDRDRWFTAQEALDYGFVDHIITRAHLNGVKP